MSYCRTCGCSGIRWTGCDNDYHYSPECVDVGMTRSTRNLCQNETDPASAQTLHGVLDTDNLYRRSPMSTSDVTTPVNTGPALDGA